MQKARILLRGKAVILMGKNTLMRKVIREQAVKNPALETLVPLVYGNMGLVFTNGNLNDIRRIVLEQKVPAAAKSGALAPADVFIPPGPTGLDPGQTAFFQALNIATKIVKGAIELTGVVHLLKVGDKVTSSHVALLTKLNILPFFYGFQVTDVYENGTVYAAKILDMNQDDLLQKFIGGIRKIAAISLAIGYPTLASLPHIIAGAFSKIIAISLETDLDVKEAKPFKDFLADPDAFKAAAAAAAPAAAAGGAGGAAAKAPEPEPEKEKSEESEADMSAAHHTHSPQVKVHDPPPRIRSPSPTLLSSLAAVIGASRCSIRRKERADSTSMRHYCRVYGRGRCSELLCTTHSSLSGSIHRDSRDVALPTSLGRILHSARPKRFFLPLCCTADCTRCATKMRGRCIVRSPCCMPEASPLHCCSVTAWL